MQYGHFDHQNQEYVIDRVDLPESWTNYLGTEEMAAVINHTAGGYLFYKSPEYHRITRFLLYLSERCRERRLLEHLLAAGRQGSAQSKVPVPSWAFLFRL